MAIQKRKKKTGTTLSEAFEMFVLEKEADNISNDTIRNYKMSFTKFCEQLEMNPDEVEIKKMDVNTINKWKAIMKKQEIRISSVNHYLRDMRAFLNWAMNNDRCLIEDPFKITMVKG